MRLPWYLSFSCLASLIFAAGFALTDDRVPVAPPAPIPIATKAAAPPRPATAAPIPPANQGAEELAETIWQVDSRGKRTGELTPDRAYTIAEAATRCEIGHWLLGGLAWFESGFRMSAESPSGRHHGLYQLHGALVDDIGKHTAAACEGLLTWRSECMKKHGGAHDWLAHHFGGNEPSPRALLSARIVRKRATKLREIGRTE
jgi:hypothetical protein